MKAKLLSLILALTPTSVLAQAQTPPTIDPATGTPGLQDLAVTVINFLLILAGALAVIFLIVGGIRYIFSGGSSDQIEKAKHTIIYAIIGVIVVIFAFVIVRLLNQSF